MPTQNFIISVVTVITVSCFTHSFTYCSCEVFIFYMALLNHHTPRICLFGSFEIENWVYSVQIIEDIIHTIKARITYVGSDGSYCEWTNWVVLCYRRDHETRLGTRFFEDSKVICSNGKHYMDIIHREIGDLDEENLRGGGYSAILSLQKASIVLDEVPHQLHWQREDDGRVLLRTEMITWYGWL